MFVTSKILKAKKITVVLTDVDGVLTDGGMYYTISGDYMKKFHARDGMGVTLLKKRGIPTIIVTKESNKIIRAWAKKMNIAKVYDGVLDKSSILKIICKTQNVTSKQICYIGDDVNDLGLLEKVGFSASPNDAISEVKKKSDFKCKNNGGHGAFRELADFIINSQNI